MFGLVGQKCGMTRVFTEGGGSIPVTVVRVQDNRVVQIKKPEVDGYSAIQVTVGSRSANRLTKSLTGHYAKAQEAAGVGLWEFLVGSVDGCGVGQVYNVAHLQAGQYVDVQGVSKGKGFAGVVKRYNFRTQDATHGNSLSHRAPGSIGQNQSPGRVFKGKRMAGQMGNKTITVQSLQVISVDLERSIALVKGAVPGAVGSYVLLKPAVKRG